MGQEGSEFKPPGIYWQFQIYGKSEEQIDSLVRAAHMLSTDIWMKYGKISKEVE